MTTTNNPGDVTGPRWVGGAPSLEDLRMSPEERTMFAAGRASRDDEVAALVAVVDSSARTYEELEAEHGAALQALAESRARYGDLEARLVEAEAALAAIGELADKAEHGALRWADPLPVPEWVPRVRALLVPSVVLADRDAAVWDQGWDAAEPFIEWCQEAVDTPNPYRGDNR